MVAKKRKSKRQTLQQKYKIVKRTKEHKKRLKKGALEGARKRKVEGGIPNAWPFKEDLLKEIAVAKQKMEEKKQLQKQRRQEEFARRRAGVSAGAEGGDGMDVTEENEDEEEGESSSTKNRLLHLNSTFGQDQDGDEDEDDTGLSMKTAAAGQNSRRAYLKELRKVIESSDVILQVLDARDPLGTRSTAVEEMVVSKADKRLVYVLNKADLVPREVLTGWLAYLRRSHPAIPFKCNTQTQKGNLGRASGKVTSQGAGGLQTNSAVGADELLQLLKNYSRMGDSKTIVAVGIVGFPNVGKSSLINSLMRTRAVGVSSMPGFTKVAQEVILDKNIRLMDSPGIVFADGDSAATALRNCVNVDELQDVLTPLQAVLERCPQAYLMQLYCIPKFKPLDAMGFLALAARATGKLKKGGIPNTDAAARSVLHDWNTGKIRYYCKPPKLSSSSDSSGLGEGDSKVLSSFSQGLDVDAMQDSDVRVLDALEAAGANDDGYVPMGDVGPQLTAVSLVETGVMDLSAAKQKQGKKKRESDGQGQNDDDGASIVSRNTVRSTGRQPKGASLPLSKTAKAALMADYEPPAADALSHKAIKDKAKKVKKAARKAGGSSGAEAYDFATDFHT
jgi:nuclear GTP-binding protein